ncbi:trypsin-like peptidase domain-containing protein [Streptomyces sp. NPDC046866]|uniref:trypsin-like peptidase domain-containing protein n=1 Tax=Streptomyces sp. NPDC046866 TaxID=3154921 RepID=UPI00345120DB
MQIVTACRDGSGKRGSGYRVRPGHVLTAAHVVDDARDVRVRFVDGRGGITDVEAATVFLHGRLDIAVLALRPAGGGPGGPPPPADGAIRYGRLGRSAPCEAVGFPRFKLRHGVGPDGAGFEYRDSRHAHGLAAAQSGRREGTLELIVDPPGADPLAGPGSASPWEGMSGAAVWSGGCLIGIVSEHRPTDGTGTLTASRVDRWYGILTDGERTALHGLIGLPAGPAGLAPADAHARQVHAYLGAALASTREHPYVGGTIGAGAPPLADIYLGQRARLRPLGLGAGRVAARELTAEEAVRRIGTQEAGVSVLMAGPGGGKTTFLRMALAEAARRRLSGDGASARAGVSPVLLQAADLLSKEPLPQVLSRAVTRDLSRFGLLEGPGADLFREEAEPGVPWLVMVDGLDEILLPQARREALQTLAAFVGRAEPATTSGAAPVPAPGSAPVPTPGGSPFRFVVATRPLPASELGILGEDTPVLELCPFDRPELRSLAVKWFRATGHAAPEQAADRFAQTRAAPPATGLGTVPLMAAILCALGSAAPDEPLPAHRGDLYRRFVDALADRHHAAGMSGIQKQIRQALEGYPSAVLDRAQETVDRFFALVARLAARQAGQAPHARAESDLLEALLGFPEAAWPGLVPEETWARFLADLLRRSGLFTEDESGFAFLHRTLADYFAAQAVAGDPALLRKELRRFLGSRRPERPRSRRARLDLRTAQLSYVGFLLDAAPEDPAGPGSRALHRLARGADAGLPDLEFIAAQARLGTRLPPDITARTASALAALATRRSLFRDELRAAVALADLDEERARALLVRIAEDEDGGGAVPPVASRPGAEATGLRMLRLYSGVARIQAALRLAESGDGRGTKLLLELAHSDAVAPLARAHAAGALAGLGYAGAGELLLSLAKDTGFDGSGRALAARLMGVRLGDRRAHRILADMARDHALDPVSRVNAAHALARLGDSRGKPVLAELARPVRGPASTPHEMLVRSFVRVKAARLLAELGEPRATELLQKLAHDESVLSFYRRRAKAVLVMVHRGVIRSGYESGAEEDLLRLDADIRERTYGRLARFLMACVILQQRLHLPFLLRRLERRAAVPPPS